MVEILQGYCFFDDENVSRSFLPFPRLPLSFADLLVSLFPQFERHLPALYPIATDILLRESAPEVREALRLLLKRAGRVRFGVSS